MEKTKKIFVAIPTYNGEKYLRQTVDSILNQTYTDFEVYIIDDCSTDSTREIAAQFPQKDGRVHLICNEKNRGACDNFNYCLELSKKTDCAYYCMISHDNLFYPDYFAKKVALMEKYPEAVMVCNASDIIDTEGKKLMVRDWMKGELIDGKKYLRKSALWGNVYGEPDCGLIRMDIIRKVGLFDKNVLTCIDFDFFNRVASFGSVGYVKQPVYAFRVIPTSMTAIGFRKDKKAEREKNQFTKEKLNRDRDLATKKIYQLLGYKENIAAFLARKLIYHGTMFGKKLIFVFHS